MDIGAFVHAFSHLNPCHEVKILGFYKLHTLLYALLQVQKQQSQMTFDRTPPNLDLNKWVCLNLRIYFIYFSNEKELPQWIWALGFQY